MEGPAAIDIRLAGIACCLLLAGAATAAPATESRGPSAQDYQRGEALFRGRIDLQGRISSHLVDLPAEVVRCANCHAAAFGPAIPRSLAPRLTRSLLLEKRARRGGPASAYDRDSFCVLLQKGLDPAHVLINVQMPRYQLDTGACQALWRFLTWDPNESSAH